MYSELFVALKTTAWHACLLLLAGTMVGFIEAGIDAVEPSQLLARYLIGQLALACAYTAIFARLAVRTSHRPWAAVIVAAALNEGIARGLLALLPTDVPSTPLVLVCIEWAVLIAALVAGTTFGIRWRSSRRTEVPAT